MIAKLLNIATNSYKCSKERGNTIQAKQMNQTQQNNSKISLS